MHKVLVNRLGGLSLPRKSVVRLIDRPDMTLDVYSGRKTTTTIHAKFKKMKSIICRASRQWSTALAVSVDWGCLDIFFLAYYTCISFLS